MFTYQVICKPFKDNLVNMLCVLNEGILFVISIIQIIFIVNLDDVKTIDMTGWIMISMVMCMIIIDFLIIIVYSFYIRCNKR